MNGAARAPIPPAHLGQTSELPPAGRGGRRRTAVLAGALAAGLLALVALVIFLPDGNTPPADGVTPSTAPVTSAGATAPAQQEPPDRRRTTGAATPSGAPTTEVGGPGGPEESGDAPTPPDGATTAPEDPEPSVSQPDATPGDDGGGDGDGTPDPGAEATRPAG